MIRIVVLFVSQTLPYSSCACVQNLPKIVTFAIGKMKLLSFSLLLDASPPPPPPPPPPPLQTQDALWITTCRYKHLQHM